MGSPVGIAVGAYVGLSVGLAVAPGGGVDGSDVGLLGNNVGS